MDPSLIIAGAWLGLCLLVGKLATDYGRNSFGWFLVSLFFSPLLGVIFLLLAGRVAAPIQFRRSVAPPVQQERRKLERAVYHYAEAGRSEGPFTARDIADFFDAGTISDSTQVIKDGDTEWRPLEFYPAIRKLVGDEE